MLGAAWGCVFLNLAECVNNDLLEGVFTGLDDAKFTLGIIRRIAGMSGVDHDGGAEFTTDGSGRCLGRIGRSENVTDFVHGTDAFVDERNAFFRAGLGPVGLWNFARGVTRHEADDVVEL